MVWRAPGAGAARLLGERPSGHDGCRRHAGRTDERATRQRRSALSSNRFDELMSVTPNGFRCVNFIRTKYADAYLSGRALLALLLPARGGGIVAFVSADPFLAGRRLFQLPERCLGLEPVYQEFAGLEGGLAMRRARPPPARCDRPASMRP